MVSHQTKYIPLAMLLLAQAALAQQAPTAGSQLQQIPASPVPQKAPPQIHIERGATKTAPPADEQKAIVRRLAITGARAFDEAELLAAAGFAGPRAMTLTELRDVAENIAEFYRSHGYALANAYLPAQDIIDGVVTITVLEGRFGAITVHNEAGLSGKLVDSLLDGLNTGDTVTVNALERRLLRLADLPGVTVKSTLAPGATAGASDLTVDLGPGQRVTGSIDADNQGNRYTGAWRAGGTVNLNNLAGLGDVASLRVLSAGSGLKYGRASYQLQLGRARAGIAYADMNYVLGKEFEKLGINGGTQVASLNGIYSLLRSRDANLNAQLAFDKKTFQDKQDSTAAVTDKRARVWMASVSGDYRYAPSNAQGSYTLSASNGDIDAPATPARSNGNFSKLGFNANHQQSLGKSGALYGALNGQFASKNLDSSEKMPLGGANAVRAYPDGEGYGDQGYVLTLEARALLPDFSGGPPGQTQMLAFVDHGSVLLNKHPFDAGARRRSLSGAGFGVNWVYGQLVVKAYYAHKLGGATASSAPDAAQRFWIQAIRFF